MDSQLTTCVSYRRLATHANQKLMNEPETQSAVSSTQMVRCQSLTTQYRQENPQPLDTFERWQVMEYIENIPLGERTEADHKAICQFIYRARCHFAELDTQWQPSND